MPTDSEIADALSGVRAGNPGLCSEFDTQVKRAKNLTYLERLEYVAWKNNRLDLFESLKYRLEAPKVPEKGRWIKAKLAGGEVVTIEVTRNAHYNHNNTTYLTEEKTPREYHVGSCSGAGEELSHIVSWEYTEPIPVELEFGSYAVLADRWGIQFFFMWDTDVQAWRALREDADGWEEVTYKTLEELKWTIIDHGALKGTVTTVWKVGDVVPAGTVVGKRWSGLYEGPEVGITRAMNYRAGDHMGRFDRRIVWIEE